MTPEEEKKFSEMTSQIMALVSAEFAKVNEKQDRLLQAAGLIQPPETKERPPVMDRIGARSRKPL